MIRYLTLNEKSPDDYWSMALLGDLIKDLPDTDRELIIVPGEYQDPIAISKELNSYPSVLLVVAADEENKFDIDKIDHPDIIIYSMFPTDKFKNVDYWLPLGYTPHTRPYLKKMGPITKTRDWFFSGQVNNDARRQLVNALSKLHGGTLKATAGFTQGLPKDVYMNMIANARTVPSPGGFVPEAFRTYEALEAGSIPIPENKDHHLKMLSEPPSVFLDDWEPVGDYIKNYSQRYPKLHNQVFAWWQMEKRQIKERFKKDLGVIDDITVVVPTSPVISNPETDIIEETVASIRHQLPDAEIIITFDGCREEQAEMDYNYQEFIRRVLWKCNYDWHNVTPVVFEKHTHQVGMMRAVMPYINTDLIVYVEHDAPFNDKPIDWQNIIQLLRDDRLDLVRFHFENVIPKEHYHMNLDREPIDIQGVPLIRTVQWSQRPHITTKPFYEEILRHFSTDAISMIEDLIHGVVHNAYLARNKAGWNDYRLAIYAPDGGYARSRHLDARAGVEKYDNKQVF